MQDINIPEIENFLKTNPDILMIKYELECNSIDAAIHRHPNEDKKQEYKKF
jgi:hypothetical protein